MVAGQRTGTAMPWQLQGRLCPGVVAKAGLRLISDPMFGVPYANADEANHAPNENLEVWRFYQGIKTSAAILASLATPRPA
jgi:hypothetical protein